MDAPNLDPTCRCGFVSVSDAVVTVKRPWSSVASIGVLVLLGTTIYWALIGQGYILLSFDAFVYFYPLITYRDSRLLEGALPLWAPDYFLGAPFLANPQTGVFYPPNWLTMWLSPPRAYAWQIFGHSLLMATGGFLVGRRVLGLGHLAAIAIGAVEAFGGFGQSLVGHMNQLQAAAWLPIAFLFADHAWSRRSLRATSLLGVVLAIQVLAGHAQQSFMTVALLGIWLVGRALLTGALTHQGVPSASPTPGVDITTGVPVLAIVRDPRALLSMIAPRVVRAIVVLGLAGAIAGLLAAPQLLPTQEIAGQGIRAGGMSYRDVVAFSLPPWQLIDSLFPAYTFDNQPGSEWLGYVGVIGMVLAVFGIIDGRPRRFAWLIALIALGAILLALGQFGPLYPVLYRFVPGLGLFRVPARWLFIYSFAIAMLIGLGVDRVRVRLMPASVDVSSRMVAWRMAAPLMMRLIAIVLALGAFTTIVGFLGTRLHIDPPDPVIILIWVGLAVLALLLVGMGSSGWHWATPLLVAVLAMELVVASWPLDVNRAGPLEAYSAMRPTEAHLLTAMAAASQPRSRTLAITNSGFDPGDLALLRSEVDGLLAPPRVEDWVAMIKHKDAMTPNIPLRFGMASIDGYDGGVLPLRSYVGMKELFPLTATNLVDGRLGIQLEKLPPVDLLSWLNVGWIVMDRHRDIWIDGAYYDLAVRTPVSPGQSITLTGVPVKARASAIGIAISLADPTRAGSPVVEVTIADAGGATQRVVINASTDGRAIAASRDSGSAPVIIRNNSDGNVYLNRSRFDTPIDTVASITLRVPSDARPVIIGGVTILDEATRTDWPIPAAPGLRFSALGDVKVYQNLSVFARAYIVHGIVPVPDDAAARVALANGLDTRASVAIAGPVTMTPPAPAEAGESVETLATTPESMELRVRLNRPGVLIVTEADYPGWTATVDGRAAPVHRANGGFRSVELDAGEHLVAMRYRSTWLSTGMVAAVIGLVLVIASWLPLVRSLPMRMP